MPPPIHTRPDLPQDNTVEIIDVTIAAAHFKIINLRLPNGYAQITHKYGPANSTTGSAQDTPVDTTTIEIFETIAGTRGAMRMHGVEWVTDAHNHAEMHLLQDEPPKHRHDPKLPPLLVENIPASVVKENQDAIKHIFRDDLNREKDGYVWIPKSEALLLVALGNQAETLGKKLNQHAVTNSNETEWQPLIDSAQAITNKKLSPIVVTGNVR